MTITSLPMNLDLRCEDADQPHRLAVEVVRWNVDQDCIVLIHDGLNDHRTPALTPDEARRLARRLTLAAEQIEAGR